MSSTDAAETPSPRIPHWLRRGLGLSPEGPHYFFYRHSLPVRAMHWFNAIVLLVMLMSGLQIFNAHPALYWGKTSDFDHPFLSLTARGNDSEVTQGVTQIGPWNFNTNGLLGASKEDGVTERARLSRVGDDPGPAMAGAGEAVAFRVRVAARAQRRVFVAYAFWSGHRSES